MLLALQKSLQFHVDFHSLFFMYKLRSIATVFSIICADVGNGSMAHARSVLPIDLASQCGGQFRGERADVERAIALGVHAEAALMSANMPGYNALLKSMAFAQWHGLYRIGQAVMREELNKQYNIARPKAEFGSKLNTAYSEALRSVGLYADKCISAARKIGGEPDLN